MVTRDTGVGFPASVSVCRAAMTERHCSGHLRHVVNISCRQ